MIENIYTWLMTHPELGMVYVAGIVTGMGITAGFDCLMAKVMR